MVACGIAGDCGNSAAIVTLALEMHKVFNSLYNQNSSNSSLAIGIAYGSFRAGVLGTSKFLYDIFGDTVNVSSRMMSTCESGKVQICGQELLEKLQKSNYNKFVIEKRGSIFVKGKGDMDTYYVHE